MPTKYQTREEWLRAAVDAMRPMFRGVDVDIPENVRVTMSLTKKKVVTGVCYDAKCSEDKHFEILIRLDQQEATEVLAILAHELIHAAVGLQERHRGAFKRVALAIGLEGKMTATVAGEELRGKLERIEKSLGQFPHARLNMEGSTSSGPKKQGTRMKKAFCEECGYTVRIAQKWLDIGTPHCTDLAHGMMKSEEEDSDEDEE